MPGTWVKRTWQSQAWLDAPAKYRRACHYRAFVPRALADLGLNIPGDVAGVIADAEAFVRRLNDSHEAALAPLAHLLLRTESIASSKIEGIQVGARQLARAEAARDTGRRRGGGISATAQELIDNITAMEHAIGEAAASASFTMKDLIAIHSRLLEHAPNAKIAGRVRAQQNWIGGNAYNPCGADFVPPPPEDVKRLLKDLCEAINDDLLPPLVQAALVHAQFETIHPFEDGNGRTGRALIHVVFRRRKVAPRFVPPISVVFAAGRQRYVDGLTEFRGDGVMKWLEQFAVATARASALADAYVRHIMDLRDSWRRVLSERSVVPREDAAAWAIIDVLPGHPVITAQMAAAATGRAIAAIYPAIDQLESAGVLTVLSGGKRNRSWEAAGLLPIVEALEAGELPRAATRSG